jgi:hypothetical protein
MANAKEKIGGTFESRAGIHALACRRSVAKLSVARDGPASRSKHADSDFFTHGGIMHRRSIRASILWIALVLSPEIGFGASAMTSMRLLYPSFAGSWATAWIAKEAGYFSDEGLTGTVITTRSFIAQQRDVALRFLRAFTQGIHRYRTDKQFSKRVLAKYGKITDEEILEGTWQDYAPTMQKDPRPSLKAIQFQIENLFKDKKPIAKPEQFVDTSLVDQLEKNGFIDSVNK